jgi:hypothetical protein
VDMQKALYEIHGDVGPHRQWNFQWLKKASGVELLHLISLAHGVGVNELGH